MNRIDTPSVQRALQLAALRDQAMRRAQALRHQALRAAWDELFHVVARLGRPGPGRHPGALPAGQEA